ncbi:prolyl oligopeptidase [Meira miltonrushii]|uniref:Prolyl endopeptidase n=1 Tax=Meira miltonrushii TaxID=1280837 RepID=A0A316VBR2_9BASI|nr:prolyl oligopeptidase [Meira miltonrushii]PWN35002.1 prolyl oligopeptidase [Meira miltonrushii]
MRSSLIQAFVGLAFATFIGVESANAPGAPFWNPKQNPYPSVKRVDKTFTYRSAKAKGNVTVADPYNWLEQPLATDAGVKGFVDDQTKLLDSYLAKCTDRKAIEQSIRDGFAYDGYSDIDFVSNAAKPFYTYTLKRAGEDQATWYVATPEEMQAAVKSKFTVPPGKKFLEEAYLSPNKTATIANWQTSLDGKYFAYLVSDSGSQVSTWFVRTFDKPLLSGGPNSPLGGDGALPDVIPNADYQLSWSADNTAFFYTGTLPSDAGSNTDIGSSVRYHVMGTAYEKDITVVKAEPQSATGNNNIWGFVISQDNKWFILGGATGTDNKARMYATRLEGQQVSDKMKWISVAPSYDYQMSALNVIDDILYVQTDLNALDSRIAKTKLDFSKARQVTNLNDLKEKLPLTTVIPEVKKAQLTSAAVFNTDKLIILYTTNGYAVAKLYYLKTGTFIRQVISNERAGGVYALTPPSKGKSIKLIVNSLTSPLKIYDITMQGTKFVETLWLSVNIKGTRPEDYTTETKFATSKDGTKVPYLVISRKGTPKNGKGAAYMHVFGSYGYTQVNYYDPALFSWLNSYGGFIVFGSPRGGGDCGNEWHVAGQDHKKQKTFEDVIAIADDLVKQKYAAPGKVIGDGGAAGAIAITAAANQSPSSFGVLLGVRPVLDYFLRKRSRGGAEQTDEFGDVDDPVDFDYVRAWSPLQNIPTKGDYPAVLMTPGAGDDQVVPAHSFKFLAEVQHDHPNNPLPLLLYLVPNGGLDNYGHSTQSAVDEGSRQHCVAQLALGLERTK